MNEQRNRVLKKFEALLLCELCLSGMVAVMEEGVACLHCDFPCYVEECVACQISNEARL